MGGRCRPRGFVASISWDAVFGGLENRLTECHLWVKELMSGKTRERPASPPGNGMFERK